MSEREPRASGRPQEFNDLVTELGDLVETLGLEEGPRPARPRRSRPASARGAAQRAGAKPKAAATLPAAVAAPRAEVEAEAEATAPTAAAPVTVPEPVAGVPDGEAAVPTGQEAAAAGGSAIWVPPAETVEPGGRPWSPAAAMEVVGRSVTAAPAGGVSTAAAGWVMTAAASTAVGLALVALVVSHVDLAHTGGPDHPISAPPFTLTQFRTVVADTSGQVATAPTITRFPTSTTHLFIDIRYQGATPNDSLQLKVIHDSDGLPPPAVVQDHTYRLDGPDGRGTLTVELTAPPGSAFTSGRYTVSLVHGPTSAQTLDFTIGTASG